MALKIVRNDITKMNTEAVVNTANQYPLVGRGCDEAIYNAAGFDDLLNYRKEYIGEVEEGNAFITPGFALEAKYIIHAVSPLFIDGNHHEETKLRACYQNSLKIALENHIHSIAFPLIATGSFLYPKEEGLRIAVDEINAFLIHHPMDVYLVVYDSKAIDLAINLNEELEEIEDITNYREAKCLIPDDLIEEGFESVLTKCSSKKEFSESDESKLEERIKHISDTFSEYLMYIIKEKGLVNSDVYKKAIVDKKVFSKIKNNINYHPQKSTVLQLCIGLELNLDETEDLLARAGYALSPSDKTDIIFSYFIENEIYDMIEIDIQLEEHGLPCIIS